MKKLKILSLVLMLLVGITCFSACKWEKTYTYEILNDAMAPALETGDRLTVKKADQYNVGDIIVFIEEESIYITRIIGSIQDEGVTYFMCKADSNPNLDGTAADGLWEDDAEYLQDLIDDYQYTKQDVESAYPYMIFITADEIQGSMIEIVKKGN